jgi:hypothetical protein
MFTGLPFGFSTSAVFLSIVCQSLLV